MRYGTGQTILLWPSDSPRSHRWELQEADDYLSPAHAVFLWGQVVTQSFTRSSSQGSKEYSKHLDPMSLLRHSVGALYR